jgi:membrane protein
MWAIVNTLVSIVVTTGLFALLFRFLPDVRLRWRDATTGAVVTAVLFTIGQQVIGLYLGQSSIASMYGAAGSMMILLLWVITRARFCCSARSSRACGRRGMV